MTTAYIVTSLIQLLTPSWSATSHIFFRQVLDHFNRVNEIQLFINYSPKVIFSEPEENNCFIIIKATAF